MDHARQAASPFMSFMDMFQDGQVMRSLANFTGQVVQRDLLGRRTDSFDIDRIAWLAASLASSDYALGRMRSAKRCSDNLEFLSYALSQVTVDGLFLEFGVFSGNTISHIARCRPEATIYGFDSFDGLPEDWRPGFPQGMFGRPSLPEVPDNVTLVQGWFDRTLPPFRDQHPDSKIAFLHIDCDLYSSTQTVLAQLKDRIVPGTVIAFDEYYNYPGWQQHERKAWAEFCDANSVSYQYIACVAHHQQVAVRVLG